MSIWLERFGISPLLFFSAITSFFFVACLVVAVVLAYERFSDNLRKKRRLKRVKRVTEAEAAIPENAEVRVFRETDGGGSMFDVITNFLPSGNRLQLLFVQSGSPMSVGAFCVFSAGTGVATGILMLLFMGSLLPAVAGAILGSFLPYFHIRRKRAQRIARFEEQFPDAVDLLGRAIRAGHPFTSGLKMVADEMRDPVAGEFRQVFEEQKFGMPVKDSLLGLAERIGLPDVRMFVTAVLIQREVGGNLAEILDKISATVRERFVLRRQVNTYTAQGRMTGYLLSGLPIGIGFIVYLLNPEYIMVMFHHPAGRVMLGVSAAMQVLAYTVINKIVTIDI